MFNIFRKKDPVCGMKEKNSVDYARTENGFVANQKEISEEYASKKHKQHCGGCCH